jgi:hypothetical protein
MSLRSLIDDITDKTGETWSRNKIRRVINDIQNELFTQPCMYTIHLDATGFPPYLVTQNNILQYDIPNITRTISGVARSLRVYQITKILIDVSTINDYDYRVVGLPFQYHGLNPYSGDIEKLDFQEIAVNSTPALEDTPASVTFKTNPGATTTTFFAEGTYEPLQLTSEEIPLTIPKRFERAIKDYVIGEIQDQNYGEDSRLARFEDFWKDQIWYYLNQGASGEPNSAAQFV